MGLYIHFARLMDEGVRRIKESDKLLADDRKLIENTRRRLCTRTPRSTRMTSWLGIQDDEIAMALSGAIAAKGIFRPETLVATRLQEFSEKVSK